MILSRPRFTIERLRTLVLIGAAVLVAAIVIFLAAGHWTRRFLTKDLPQRLGANIEQHADGVTYTQTRKGKTIFKIKASRADTMHSDGSTLLHDVVIDLYGEDGQRTDTIAGSEFQYDPKAGVATAAGAVEITMMRPGVKPAISQLNPGAPKSKPTEEQQPKAAADPNVITDNEIHVKTSGLAFNQKTGVATTSQRVDFALRQGSGNSIGATYDSQNGQLILDRHVELHVRRAGGPVTVHAGHAEFEHGEMLCQLTQAEAEYTGGEAQTANAQIHFRDDGSVDRLDGSGGVDLRTSAGSHVTAPHGTLEFDENNHPRHGLLQGGAHLELTQPNRQVQGSSPTAQLTFDREGQLSQAHMEKGVLFDSRQQTTTAKGAATEIHRTEVHRTWNSQTADVAFAPVTETQKPGKTASPAQNAGKASNRIEPRTIHGYGGVVVTSETASAGIVIPSRLSADTVAAELAPGGALSSLLGTGHASFEERTAAGVHQASTADQLDLRFVSGSQASLKTPAAPSQSRQPAGASDIASIVEIGHVVLVQDPPPSHADRAAQKPDAQTGLRATASRADYDGQSEILHLTGTPRVRDGALDMTADRIDFARASGDAFAHGDVRASWIGSTSQSVARPAPLGVGPASSDSALPGASLLADGSGGNGPVHAVAAEAELHQATQEIVFRNGERTAGNGRQGIEPRLWQAANSVAAPVIVLNRQKMTLLAEANGTANPVRTVLLSNAPANSAGSLGNSQKVSHASADLSNADLSNSVSKGKSSTPSVIRVRSGDLRYSEGERLALFHSGSVGSVTAETAGRGGTSTVVSQMAEVRLLPAGAHSGTTSPANASASAAGTANSSVDRLTAQGHVTVDWPDRHGTGEKLVYLSDDGTYTLTGTSSAPPRISDQSRGTVTGSALVYHSREDTVTVEGDGGKTETETQFSKQRKLP